MKALCLFCAAASVLALHAGSSKAIVLNVGGLDYDVTRFTGTYNNNASKFNIPASGGVMPWWGNGSLANSFAAAAFARRNDFGFPNSGTLLGPFFAFSSTSGSDGTLVDNFTYATGSDYVSAMVSRASSRAYAQATLLPPSAVPGPMPVLGAAAAYGLSRKLRQRIRQNA
jgi:hypothetical protein